MVEVAVNGWITTPEGKLLQGRIFKMENVNSLAKKFCTRETITRGKVI